MRAINAALIRLANVNGPGPFRTLFANLAKLANINQDMWARASFLEGALGREPLTLSRNPGQFFRELRSQIEAKEGTYYSVLIYEKGFTDDQLMGLASDRNEGVFLSLKSGIKKAMQPYDILRSVDAEGAATAIAFGISPVTHEKLRKFGSKTGEGFFYYYGNRGKGHSVGALKKLAIRGGYREGVDLKKTALSQHEQSTAYLDAPVREDQETVETLMDVLQGGGGLTEFPGWGSGLATTLVTQQGVLEVLSPMVSAELKTPTQVAVWEALRENPDILDAKGSSDGQGLKITVSARELAKEVAALMEREYTGKSMDVVVRKVFNDKILPAMYSALKTDAAAKEFLRSREIREVMLSEMRRRKKSPKTHGSVGISGVPETPTRPTKKWRELEGEEFKAVRDRLMELERQDPERAAKAYMMLKKRIESDKKRQDKLESKLPRLLKNASYRNFTASDRESLIRLASSLPKGSFERRAILTGLKSIYHV